jgi:hypothetical protein
MRNKKRGSRGTNWQRLEVQWRIAVPSSFKSYSKEDIARLRLTAFLRALETGAMPSWARISYLAWQNPDADWEPPPIINDNQSALEALATLNRGGWLETRVNRELYLLGGPIEPASGKPRKKKRRQSTTARKKLANRRKPGTSRRYSRKPSPKKK